MAKLYLPKGQVVLVDDDDLEKVSQYHWYLNHYGEVVAEKIVKGARLRLKLHRLIMDAPKELTVDHISGDRLDNRKENLRLCTLYQNNLNKAKTKRNSTGYKGVDFFKQYKKYRARIRFNKKEYHLGYFDRAIDAAKAYDVMAQKLHGEFARLNNVIR